MSLFYRAARPAIFALPPETTHRLTHVLGEGLQRIPLLHLLKWHYRVPDPRLEVTCFDETFPSPLGVAAGFDKNGRIVRTLGTLGFGHVEIGGVTARPQSGNPRPRLFRLPEDQAVINRMGFNNDGADRIAARRGKRETPPVPLGVNLGKSKGVPAQMAPDDFLYSYERLAPHGDFFVINVSSPNTPGLRELQERTQLERIVDRLLNAGADPLLVKVSPDLHEEAIHEVCAVVEDRELDGVIATNTTTERQDLRSPHRAEPGGLSGRPLRSRATEVIRTVAARTDRPIVGVGGISTAADAYEKIRAGATLVQLYTALIYRGPGIAATINQGLLEYLERDGFDTIEDAVGVEAP